MQDAIRRIARVAPRNCSVLLHGESGTGKELAAREIHRLSTRSEKPFVAVDSAALSEGLFESQLFGHVRGAFTGADRASQGFIRAAHGGTLFLDEIGELPLACQSKLLRVLQERVLVPVGSAEPIPVDVRVLAATHRDLRGMVESGTFRLDLYYRLSVMTISIPPLRERLEDLEGLTDQILTRLSTEYREAKPRLTPRARAVLREYCWPGNVRELINVLESGCVICEGGELTAADLPITARVLSTPVAAEQEEARGEEMFLPDDLTLDKTVRATLSLAMRVSNGNKVKAAEILGIDRKTLLRKLRKYELEGSGDAK